MTGYELYSFYRKLMGWNVPLLDNYLHSKEYNFFESLKDFFIKVKNLDDSDIYDYVKLIYNKNSNTFSPYFIHLTEVYVLFS